ncbi:cysteine protease ATG4B-like, partial [Lampetra fluviatilis]
SAGERAQCGGGTWRPLLLLIPLRLGLTEINPIYIPSLQDCFTFPQSLGFIGGKPNSAHYFIGYVGDELLYLDPHTCQNAVEPDSTSRLADSSFHCPRASRIHITQLDPSIALGFFCKTESDWSNFVTKVVVARSSLPMFELIPSRPLHWPPFVPPSKPDVLQAAAGFTQVERPDEARFYDSDDDEFEILQA